MKQLHRTNLILIWVATAILSIVSLMIHPNPVCPILVMIIASVISTITYFLPLQDMVKGVVSLDVISFATLTLSIIEGGNVHCYIASYFVLGLIALYFEPVIMKFHLITYIPYCIIAYLIEPAYISGATTDKTTGIYFIAVYLITGITILFANARGKKNLLLSEEQRIESEAQREKILKSNKQSQSISVKLNTMVEESNTHIYNLTTNADIITEATQQMTSVLQETEQSIGIVNRAIKDSKDKVDHNYELASSLNKSYQEVETNVHIGNEKGDHMKDSVDAIEQTVMNARESTQQLLQNTQKITDILEKIDEIAAQTNLLALNASIEAARAGEHGRGFSVVADEIRVLSEQSKSSSNIIREILNQLSSDIEEVSKKIIMGAESVTESKANLESLLSILQKISICSKESALSIKEQFDVIEDMKKNFDSVSIEVENVVSMSEENSSMIESVVESVQNQSENVEKMTKTFMKIEDISKQLIQK